MSVKEPSKPPNKNGRSNRRRLAMLLIGLIALAALLMVVFRFSEISAFTEQIAKAQPLWLVLAAGIQLITYCTVAFIWWLVLYRLGKAISLFGLFPLSIAKLFADQLVPSGGISGAAFMLYALGRRGISQDHAFTAFIIGGSTFIAAFLMAALVGFVSLAAIGDASIFLPIGVGVFYLTMLAIILMVIRAMIVRPAGMPTWLTRWSIVRKGADLVSIAITHIAVQKVLFTQIVVLQIFQRGLDALTLWLVFFSIGLPVSLPICFIAIALASVAATLAPTPMGVGSFEGGAVASLVAFGAPLEASVTAIVLYRGFTLWLPMAAGFVIIQREMFHLRKLSKAPEKLSGPDS